MWKLSARWIPYYLLIIFGSTSISWVSQEADIASQKCTETIKNLTHQMLALRRSSNLTVSDAFDKKDERKYKDFIKTSIETLRNSCFTEIHKRVSFVHMKFLWRFRKLIDKIPGREDAIKYREIISTVLDGIDGIVHGTRRKFVESQKIVAAVWNIVYRLNYNEIDSIHPNRQLCYSIANNLMNFENSITTYSSKFLPSLRVHIFAAGLLTELYCDYASFPGELKQAME